MTIEDIRNHCLGKEFVTESFPFDNETLVFKVKDKMFALFSTENFTGVNLKCDPERAITLREEHQGINPGWHMSKTHWNTVEANSDVSLKLMLELIDHSYDLIVSKLPKKIQIEFTSR